MKVFKEALINFLKGAAVKAALKKILGSAAVGGFRAWLIRYIVIELFEEVAQPLIEFLLRKGALVYDKTEGKIRLKKLEMAKVENNETDYNTSVDNL